MRLTSPDSTLPEPISTNCVTPRRDQLLHGLREAHRRGQLLHEDLGQVGAARARPGVVTVEKNGVAGSCERGRLERRPQPPLGHAR